LSEDQYRQFISQSKVVLGTSDALLVTKVGQKIQQAVNNYFNKQNMSHRLDGYKWEFHLVEDTSINAFAMPGGKTVVFTGILPLTRDETGLAVVMGHEIAHAVANHGNERMSQLLIVQLGGMALSEALTKQTELTRQLSMAAFGIGSQVGILLPYSRLQESEADRLGLIFMALAGYDPREAIPFWQRMSQQNKASIPEFLSTHPSNDARIANIEKLLPEAMSFYKSGVTQ
jgi:predicted Zn-dependent protease